MPDAGDASGEIEGRVTSSLPVASVARVTRRRVTRPAVLAPRVSAWRVLWWFGFVSLAADMVYQGGRSMYRPLLASRGASALVVGLVTGAGEAMALVLRLVFGPLADRTGR